MYIYSTCTCTFTAMNKPLRLYSSKAIYCTCRSHNCSVLPGLLKSQGEIVLHPADEGQKLETAVQGLHLLSFGTAHMHIHMCDCVWVSVCVCVCVCMCVCMYTFWRSKTTTVYKHGDLYIEPHTMCTCIYTIFSSKEKEMYTTLHWLAVLIISLSLSGHKVLGPSVMCRPNYITLSTPFPTSQARDQEHDISLPSHKCCMATH